MQSFEVQAQLDLNRFFSPEHITAFAPGCDGRLYVVTNDGFDGTNFAGPIARHDKVQQYKVWVFEESELVSCCEISDRFHISFVQPLPFGHVLLASSRAQFRKRDDFDHNGRVYDTQGKLVSKLALGDGIEDLQTDSTGTIWASYFDEGVLGNFGWTEPVGNSGLVAWSSFGSSQDLGKVGTKLYEFVPSSGLEPIFDCYALNVASASNVWFYYYAGFDLVHLFHKSVKSSWRMPIKGSHSFTVSKDTAIFSGGYDDEKFHVFNLRKGGNKRASFDLKTNTNRTLKIKRNLVVARSDVFYLVDDGVVYCFSVDQVIDRFSNG